MSSQWITPRGGWSYGPSSSPSIASEECYSDNSGESTRKDSYWKGKLEEGAREMRKLEDPKLRNMVDWDLQAQIDLLIRRIVHEEAYSHGSPLYIKLLQDCREAMNTKNMRNMQTIATLEKDVEYYKEKLSEEFALNMKLSEGLIKIWDSTNKEFLKAMSGRSAPTTQAWGVPPRLSYH